MNRLKEMREDKDLLQKDIADLLSIPTRTYASYEKEERSIPLNILAELINIYNTSCDYLLYLTDDRSSYKKK